MAADDIQSIDAREVLDSRGHPTVEVEIHCRGGASGRAIVPSGASTGRHEALELRDHDPARYGGKGVRRAVANVHEHIRPRLLGMPASAQRELDQWLIALDGTADKSRLGANAILGVSLACAHAAAAARNVPLWQYLDAGAARMPLPMVNLISGGLHAGRNLEFQDFLLIPIGARSYSEALQMTVAVYRALAGLLQDGGFEGVLVGDEGGFGPKLANNEEAVKIIVAAIERAGMKPGRDAAIALDVASTHFHDAGQYLLRDRVLDAAGLTELLSAWVGQHPIVSIEDGMAEDDWAGWKKLTQALGSRVQLIGDDLFVTNPTRLARGIQEGVANSILIKVNQIGTLTETLDVIGQARAADIAPVISARSGETEDTTIADLAVATGAGQIKIGSVARGERLAKYNQLLRIEEQMERERAVCEVGIRPFVSWNAVMNDPYLAIQVVMMPRDTNPLGSIFGGVILSYIDQAGAIGARREVQRGGGSVPFLVTVAVNRVEFKLPVLVGDVVRFMTRPVRVGRTSITMQISVEAERGTEVHHVTEAEVVYVGIDPATRRPLPLFGGSA